MSKTKNRDNIEFFLGIMLIFVAGYSLDLSNANSILVSALLALSGFESICRGAKIKFYANFEPFLRRAKWILIIFIFAKILFSF